MYNKNYFSVRMFKTNRIFMRNQEFGAKNVCSGYFIFLQDNIGLIFTTY